MWDDVAAVDNAFFEAPVKSLILFFEAPEKSLILQLHGSRTTATIFCCKSTGCMMAKPNNGFTSASGDISMTTS